eukprot:3631188-Pleurochrysis_carterae.AAC.2
MRKKSGNIAQEAAVQETSGTVCGDSVGSRAKSHIRRPFLLAGMAARSAVLRARATCSADHAALACMGHAR